MSCAKRLSLLYSFLKRNLSKKVMVFFSSCKSVEFHSELLRYIQVTCFSYHGKQNQQKRRSTILNFCKAEKGILLCTDLGSRGLDIPSVVCSFLLSFLPKWFLFVALVIFALRFFWAMPINKDYWEIWLSTFLEKWGLW